MEMHVHNILVCNFKKKTTTLHVKECERAITWRGAQYSQLNSCTTLPSSVSVGWFRFWLPVFYLQSFHFYFVIVFLFLSKFVFLFFSPSLEIFVSIYPNDAFLFKLHCLLRDDRNWYGKHFSWTLEDEIQKPFDDACSWCSSVACMIPWKKVNFDDKSTLTTLVLNCFAHFNEIDEPKLK